MPSDSRSSKPSSGRDRRLEGRHRRGDKNVEEQGVVYSREPETDFDDQFLSNNALLYPQEESYVRSTRGREPPAAPGTLKGPSTQTGRPASTRSGSADARTTPPPGSSRRESPGVGSSAQGRGSPMQTDAPLPQGPTLMQSGPSILPASGSLSQSHQSPYPNPGSSQQQASGSAQGPGSVQAPVEILAQGASLMPQLRCDDPSCRQEFASKNAYQYHLNREHPGQRVICPACDRDFIQVSSLFDHAAGHTIHGSGPYYCRSTRQCEGAKQGFATERDRDAHLRITHLFCPVRVCPDYMTSLGSKKNQDWHVWSAHNIHPNQLATMKP